MPTTDTLSPPRTTARRLILSAVAADLLTAALALLWLTGRAPVPLAEPGDALALLVLSPDGLAGLVAVVALAGAVAGSALIAARPGGTGPPAVVAAVQVAVFGVAVSGIGAIALAGYLVAMAVPVAAVVLAVQVLRRYPRLRPVAALAVLAVLGWAAVAGVVRPATLVALVTNLATGFASSGPRLLATVLFAATAGAWALVLLALARGTRWTGRATATVVRHRRAVTVVAALGPVPYVLTRSTWLTPWPLFGGPVGELTPEIRLWGLLLGTAAAVGALLTVGLIRPWGEVFPRWVPRLAGRPVPVAAAAVPGGVVAAVLTASAAPMLVAMLTSDLPAVDRALSVLLFPFGVWGPALALAVWGYVGHRRSAGAAG